MVICPAIVEAKSALTIVCISDTHELHRELDVPSGDILIHAGDFTMFSKNAGAISDFNEWLGELRHVHKLVVPGNHEFFLESEPSGRRLISNATILIDEAIEMMGLTIWGSPVTPLSGAAFGQSSAIDRANLYSKIPNDVDIMITHGPPSGILDSTPESIHPAGCPELLKAVSRLRPRLHIFGHVHGARGTRSKEGTLFVNAALMGPDGELDNAPIILRLPRI